MHSDECCVTTAPKQCFFRAQSNAVPVSPILRTLLGVLENPNYLLV